MVKKAASLEKELPATTALLCICTAQSVFMKEGSIWNALGLECWVDNVLPRFFTQRPGDQGFGAYMFVGCLHSFGSGGAKIFICPLKQKVCTCR